MKKILGLIVLPFLIGFTFSSTALRDATNGFPTALVTPTGYSKMAASTNPITDAIKQAQPGDLIELGQGYFRRCGPFPSSRVVGSAPVTIVGQGAATTILRDTTVGSTDAIYLGPGDHDLVFKNFYGQLDDRSGIKTVTGCGPNLTFEDVHFSGFGWPGDPNGWKDDSKWGYHGYDTNGLYFRKCSFWNVFGEHAWYDHGSQGDVLLEDCSAIYTGRTAFQSVCRMSEGKEGKGTITIRRCYFSENCLEQGGGGSSITIAGGRPTSDVVIDSTTVKLGCDPSLQAPFNQNITGCMVFSSPQESAPGKGDGAWPGGVHIVSVAHCNFEVGTLWSGQGSALRSNVKIDCPAVGYFFDDDSILTKRGAGQIAVALEVTAQAGPVHFTHMRDVTGAVNYKGEKFQTFAAFQAAHPECFQ